MVTHESQSSYHKKNNVSLTKKIHLTQLRFAVKIHAYIFKITNAIMLRLGNCFCKPVHFSSRLPIASPRKHQWMTSRHVPGRIILILQTEKLRQRSSVRWAGKKWRSKQRAGVNAALSNLRLLSMGAYSSTGDLASTPTTHQQHLSSSCPFSDQMGFLDFLFVMEIHFFP